MQVTKSLEDKQITKSAKIVNNMRDDNRRDYATVRNTRNNGR